MIEERSYLGRGWAFPPSFNKVSAEVMMVSEEDDIAESLEILLSTRPGERVMQPNYGCNLDIMLFEPLTTTLITFLKDLIQTSILYYEPRIELSRIGINAQEVEEGVILIDIDYTVRSSNSRFNLVYPFYLEEGTEVKPVRLKQIASSAG